MRSDLLVSFYGDDFTGSTDVMEALSARGIETVLFTRLPAPERLTAFGHCRAVGLAGTSRSQSPDWMDRELPPIYGWLKSLGAHFCHYKVCSTFDSAPGRGNIGRATELGLAAFGQHRAHVVVGAPQLRRYTFAGQLFAGYRDAVFRIDRHPVMSRHPATPMREADLLVHLAAQTGLASQLIGFGDRAWDAGLAEEARLALVDVHDTATQLAAADVLERAAEAGDRFLVGSSGVEYALLAAWQARGEHVGPAGITAPDAVPTTAVVSGSCSPTTARQIETAAACGFAPIPIDYRALATGEGREAAVEAAISAGSSAIGEGRSPLVHTALGAESGAPVDGADAAVGAALGQVLSCLQERHALRRIIIAGGDTSSHAIGVLGIDALTLRHPIPDSPGSPLCTAHDASGPRFEIALKGGQIGTDDYFARLRDGRLAAA